MAARMVFGRWAAAAGVAFLGVVCLSVFIWRDDIVRTWLDPKQPFQTYQPPPAPDYSHIDAWARIPAHPSLWSASDPAADVFFVHPTTFDGGADWNGPVHDRRSSRFLEEVILPNYAGAFQSVGRVFAPRYRQASLYAFMTNREDAQDSRRFAYADVKRAFQTFLKFNDGRPIILVGVEQGGSLTARLLHDVVAADPAVRARLAVTYLIDTVVPAVEYKADALIPACERTDEAGCVVAFEEAASGRDAALLSKRALVWSATGGLENLGDRRPLCVNPVLGIVSKTAEAPRLTRGSTNASGLEWGVRPAFLPRQVSAQCINGYLRTSKPQSPTLRRGGGWIEHLKEAPFNFFYADEEADARTRLAALLSTPGYRPPSPSSGDSIQVVHSPIHRAF